MDSTANLSQNSCIFLEDLATGIFIDLKANPSGYSFYIEDTTDAPRFLLRISEPQQETAVKPSCIYKTNGKAIIHGSSSVNWSCDWMDELGNILMTHTNISGADTLYNLSPGKYIYSITANSDFCGALSDTIEVLPADTIVVTSIVNNQSCNNVPSGSINPSVTGGVAPYSYAWSNGMTTAVNNNLLSGVYTLILNDANGCADTSYHAVQNLSALSVAFAVSADTVMTNTPVNFTNTCSGQSMFAWDFGDGSSSTALHPVHSYTVPGSYTVELVAADITCSDVARKVILVMMPTSISKQELSNAVTIINSGQDVRVKFDLYQAENAEINLFNIEGKLLSTKKAEVFQGSEEVDLNGFASGIYLVEVKIKENSVIKKITK
jgi:PKD repeat protein